MTKWAHFRHTLGLHQDKKVQFIDGDEEVELCGEFDPGPKTKPSLSVEVICCECGRKKIISYREWLGW